MAYLTTSIPWDWPGLAVSNFGFLLGFSLVLENVKRSEQVANNKKIASIFGFSPLAFTAATVVLSYDAVFVLGNFLAGLPDPFQLTTGFILGFCLLLDDSFTIKSKQQT